MMLEDKKDKKRQEVFIEIEKTHLWGEADNPSGEGSSVEVTKITREILLKVVTDYNISSMVDVACGDFKWMPIVLEQLPKSFKYIGQDIVPKLVEKNTAEYPQYEFKVSDFVRDDLPIVDMIFCRDVLQHLPIPDIKLALKNFSKSGAKYLLTTTHLRRTGWRNYRYIKVGGCTNRNLLLKPFSLPDPLIIYCEQFGDKFLGLWKLPLFK